MKSTINWGIIGCGKIAKKFAADLAYVENTRLVGVASRSAENAKQFAAEFKCINAYGDYTDLVNNKDVDVVYVATPHSHHYEHSLLCIHAGKAVLCEKAFAVNARQAAEMISVARSRGVFLMEALWTHFLPHHQKMIRLVQDGMIGDIRSVLVNFGFTPQQPVAQRLYDPLLAGGTVLDIGVYNVFTAMSVLGKPDAVEASMTPSVHGTDEQCAALLKYNNGAFAQLFSTFVTDLSCEANIAGSKGRLRLTHRFYAPESSIEYYPGRPETVQVIESDHVKEGFGYQFETRHVVECLLQGKTESDEVTHAETLARMEVLDAIRYKAGILYPADK